MLKLGISLIQGYINAYSKHILRIYFNRDHIYTLRLGCLSFFINSDIKQICFKFDFCL